MGRLYKAIGLGFIASALFFVTACNPFASEPDEVNTTIPEISGTESKVLMVEEEYDWLQDVHAYDEHDGDLTDQVEYDDSDLDMSSPGVYTITYYVEDSAGNYQEKTITVEVVEFTEEHFINLDSDLYYSLTGDELTGDELETVESIAALRVENSGRVFNENFNTDVETFEEMFIRELDEDELNHLKDYSNMWDSILDNIDNEEFEPYEQLMKFISLSMGREFSDDDYNAAEFAYPIENLYEENVDLEEYPEFVNATKSDIEAVIDDEITEDEYGKVETYQKIMEEYMVYMALNEFRAMIERHPTYEERQAFLKMFSLIDVVEASNEFLPTIEEIEDHHNIELTEEQISAYGKIENIILELYSIGIREGLEYEWGRELTDYEIDYVFDLTPVMIAYQFEFNPIEDPEFHEATKQQLEEMIDRELTAEEKEAREYILNMSLVYYLEGELDRELTEEEIETVSEYRVLGEEYNNNKDDEDPEFEDADEEKIEEVLDRDLTEEEKDMLEDMYEIYSD